MNVVKSGSFEWWFVVLRALLPTGHMHRGVFRIGFAQTSRFMCGGGSKNVGGFPLLHQSRP